MHCKKTGHTQDKCYRLHGFPPGYRTQSHANSIDIDQTSPAINQSQQVSSDVRDALTGLTQQQCENLIAMLSGQLASANMVTTSANHASISENLAGKYIILSLISGNYMSNVWILDLGATQHICNDKGIFKNLQTICGTRVRLLNHSLIPVHYKGDIQLTNQLYLTNVIYVPQFELNLI